MNHSIGLSMAMHQTTGLNPGFGISDDQANHKEFLRGRDPRERLPSEQLKIGADRTKNKKDKVKRKKQRSIYPKPSESEKPSDGPTCGLNELANHISEAEPRHVYLDRPSNDAIKAMSASQSSSSSDFVVPSDDDKTVRRGSRSPTPVRSATTPRSISVPPETFSRSKDPPLRKRDPRRTSLTHVSSNEDDQPIIRSYITPLNDLLQMEEAVGAILVESKAGTAKRRKNRSSSKNAGRKVRSKSPSRKQRENSMARFSGDTESRRSKQTLSLPEDSGTVSFLQQIEAAMAESHGPNHSHLDGVITSKSPKRSEGRQSRRSLSCNSIDVEGQSQLASSTGNVARRKKSSRKLLADQARIDAINAMPMDHHKIDESCLMEVPVKHKRRSRSLKRRDSQRKRSPSFKANNAERELQEASSSKKQEKSKKSSRSLSRSKCHTELNDVPPPDLGAIPSLSKEHVKYRKRDLKSPKREESPQRIPLPDACSDAISFKPDEKSYKPTCKKILSRKEESGVCCLELDESASSSRDVILGMGRKSRSHSKAKGRKCRSLSPNSSRKGSPSSTLLHQGCDIRAWSDNLEHKQDSQIDIGSKVATIQTILSKPRSASMNETSNGISGLESPQRPELIRRMHLPSLLCDALESDSSGGDIVLSAQPSSRHTEFESFATFPVDKLLEDDLTPSSFPRSQALSKLCRSLSVPRNITEPTRSSDARSLRQRAFPGFSRCRSMTNVLNSGPRKQFGLSPSPKGSARNQSPTDDGSCSDDSTYLSYLEHLAFEESNFEVRHDEDIPSNFADFPANEPCSTATPDCFPSIHALSKARGLLDIWSEFPPAVSLDMVETLNSGDSNRFSSIFSSASDDGLLGSENRVTLSKTRQERLRAIYPRRKLATSYKARSIPRRLCYYSPDEGSGAACNLDSGIRRSLSERRARRSSNSQPPSRGLSSRSKSQPNELKSDQQLGLKGPLPDDNLGEGKDFCLAAKNTERVSMSRGRPKSSRIMNTNLHTVDAFEKNFQIISKKLADQDGVPIVPAKSPWTAIHEEILAHPSPDFRRGRTISMSSRTPFPSNTPRRIGHNRSDSQGHVVQLKADPNGNPKSSQTELEYNEYMVPLAGDQSKSEILPVSSMKAEAWQSELASSLNLSEASLVESWSQKRAQGSVVNSSTDPNTSLSLFLEMTDETSKSEDDDMSASYILQLLIDSGRELKSCSSLDDIDDSSCCETSVSSVGFMTPECLLAFLEENNKKDPPKKRLSQDITVPKTPHILTLNEMSDILHHVSTRHGSNENIRWDVIIRMVYSDSSGDEDPLRPCTTVRIDEDNSGSVSSISLEGMDTTTDFWNSGGSMQWLSVEERDEELNRSTTLTDRHGADGGGGTLNDLMHR